jgi:steroid delta-isomerase-like uncharacterized protein
MAGSEVDVARETIDCFNAGDWARLRELTAPDCVEEEYSTERTLHGVEEILGAAQGWKRAFPDGRGTVLGSYSDGPIAVLEIEWEGTNTGPMDAPDGSQMPATGRSGAVRACQVMEIHDGRVTSNRHYFNLLTIMTQLGVAPGSEVQAAH